MSRKSSCKLSRHGWLFRSFVLLQANLAIIQLRNLSGGNTAVCPSVVSGVVGGCHCVYWVHN